MSSLSRILLLAVVIIFCMGPAQVARAAGVISLQTADVAYTQNFNGLANTGTGNTILPDGWDFLETGSNANTFYTAGSGSSSTGDTYSFGPSGSGERAFGGLQSGALVPTLGAQFINNIGVPITSLAIAYTGEQWRAGATNRNAADVLDFQYSLDAESLTNGVWTDFDTLDFNSPNINATAGALDGNAASNRATVTATITELSIPNGATFWIRWQDFNPADSDDGLAIDDFSLTPGDGDFPPRVIATSPSNGTTTAFGGTDLLVTFNEPVNAPNPAFQIKCSNSSGHTFSLSGGPSTFTINPDNDFVDGDLCTLVVKANQVTDLDLIDPPDQMTADHIVSFSVVDECSYPYTPIPQIQGSGTAGISGQVTTQGVVIGDYEGPDALRGYYIQDLSGDGNLATSDGIFIFDSHNGDTVHLGDVVRVTGIAGEYQDQSQITMERMVPCGRGTVAPTDVILPFPSLDFPERYEGMLVRLPQALFVTEHYNLGRFGEVVLSSGGRLVNPTSVVAPGPAAVLLQAQNLLNFIVIDDASQIQNPDPILFGRGGNQLSAANPLRAGDTAAGIVGVMTYTWGGSSSSPNTYRVRPVNALSGYIIFQPANPRPAAAPGVGGTLRVVGMNLLSFFNTFTGCTNGVGGPATDCRGADSQAEFDRQWPKTVAAIQKMDPDILGIVEVENDGYGPASAISFLVDRLNDAAPGTYTFIDADANTGQTNALGTDAVKVGLIYKPALVTPLGQTAGLNSADFVNGGDSQPRNRPSLAQAFEVNASGARFIIDINHLKSKGSACEIPDLGDGQGNCAAERANAALALVQWLATDPTGIGDPDVLIIGDLNAYTMEEAITNITNTGFTNLIDRFLGRQAYSYAYVGQWGYLDHALATPSLAVQVTGVADYHINADEPSALDYSLKYKSEGQKISLYAADEFRVADHDPVIIGLNLVKFDHTVYLPSVRR